MAPSDNISGERFPSWLVAAIVVGILIFFGAIVSMRVLVAGKSPCCFTFRRATSASSNSRPVPGRRAYPTATLFRPRQSNVAKILEDDTPRYSRESISSPPPPYRHSINSHSRSPSAQSAMTSVEGCAGLPARRTSSPSPPPAYLGLGGRVYPTGRPRA